MRSIGIGIVICSILACFQMNERCKLQELESNILRDQIQDMAFTFTNAKTYEDGLKEGFENSKSGEFVRGYHYATAQFSEQKELMTDSK